MSHCDTIPASQHVMVYGLYKATPFTAIAIGPIGRQLVASVYVGFRLILHRYVCAVIEFGFPAFGKVPE